MTPLPDGSFPNHENDAIEAKQIYRCVICKSELEDQTRLHCKTRRCMHEYQRKVGKVRASKEYREYIFWYSWSLTHLEWEIRED